MSDIIETPVADLIADERCQARECMNEEALEEYTRRFSEGEAPPQPVEVFEVAGEPVIVDGFHRREAAIRAGVATLTVEVVGEGSIDEAIWVALTKNQQHGVRRKKGDATKAILMALDNPRSEGMSNRKLAKHVGCSHTLVASVRREAERGEQIELPQPKADPDELWQGASERFETDDFAGARLLYEKAMTVTPVEARGQLKTCLRICDEQIAPQKRARRIFPLSHSIMPAAQPERCTVCGLGGGAVVSLEWTRVSYCAECLSAMQRAAERSAEAAADEQLEAEAAE